MKKIYFTTALVALSVAAMSIAYASERPQSSRLPQLCEAFVYSSIDKQLPAGEMVTQIRRSSDDASKVEIDLLLDQGNDNFCLNSGEATIRDDGSGACEVLDFHLENPHFDCG